MFIQKHLDENHAFSDSKIARNVYNFRFLPWFQDVDYVGFISDEDDLEKAHRNIQRLIEHRPKKDKCIAIFGVYSAAEFTHKLPTGLDSVRVYVTYEDEDNLHSFIKIKMIALQSYCFFLLNKIKFEIRKKSYNLDTSR